MNSYGYHFYFNINGEILTLPITPGELTISTGSNNKVITLINEGDVNILKSPSLTEISFEARFPMRKYPYSREVLSFEKYHNAFTDLMVKKQPFVFTVVRTTPNGKGTWGTTRKVSLEKFETNESADEGDDVIVSFELKEYKEYSIRTVKLPQTKPPTTSTASKPRPNDNKDDKSQKYTVKDGDCLWNIAKKFYGNGLKWTVIYDANKNIINETARKRGLSSSSNGHWIFTGTVLTIPAL